MRADQLLKKKNPPFYGTQTFIGFFPGSVEFSPHPHTLFRQNTF